MNDLIWREDALNALNLVDAPFLPMNTNEHIAYVYALKNLPSVDAVEVVRCENCAYWHRSGMCTKEWMSRDAMFYCRDGERRNDG